jgi:poly-gamma-glutamate synthesis protein (capsule biosynthesis protein)
MPNDLVTLFLCGDVMTGRGVDQILPHPGSPRLWESRVRDARVYVQLAESVNGPIPSPVDYSWPWGDALGVLDDLAPDVRVLNLETSISRSDDAADGKAVHYRMSPENIDCLTVARPDVCALANNHVLDFGYRGLAETQQALASAGISAVGAGRDLDGATRPAVLESGRVIVYSLGARSSGIPEHWAATPQRAGINLLPHESGAYATRLAHSMVNAKSPGDILVASVHWGSNWGYSVPRSQVEVAHRLIDGGVDVVHGHSSHHVRPIEVYQGKLILYGCGDFIDDYEGISGYEEFRDDLRLMYFVTIERGTGTLVGLRVAPMQARQMRLNYATRNDTHLLLTILNDISRGYGSRFDHSADDMLDLVMTT